MPVNAQIAPALVVGEENDEVGLLRRLGKRRDGRSEKQKAGTNRAHRSVGGQECITRIGRIESPEESDPADQPMMVPA